MTFKVKNLKEICSLAIIKLGLSRQELPTTLIREVEQFEERIVVAFPGGRFSIVEGRKRFSHRSDAVIDLTIYWVECKLAIAVKIYNNMFDDDPAIEQTIVIQCGVENDLSVLGNELFGLPGKQISIVDYNIDLQRRELILFGSFSSSTMPRKKALKSVLKMQMGPDCYYIGLIAKTWMYEDSYDGDYKFRRSLWFSSYYFYSARESSESDSDCSFGSGMVEADSNFSDCNESMESKPENPLGLNVAPSEENLSYTPVISRSPFFVFLNQLPFGMFEEDLQSDCSVGSGMVEADSNFSDCNESKESESETPAISRSPFFVFLNQVPFGMFEEDLQ